MASSIRPALFPPGIAAGDQAAREQRLWDPWLVQVGCEGGGELGGPVQASLVGERKRRDQGAAARIGAADAWLLGSRLEVLARGSLERCTVAEVIARA